MKKDSVTPIGDRVLIKPRETKKDPVSKLVLPESIDDVKPNIGTVIALGTGKIGVDGKTMPFNVKVGDEVAVMSFDKNEIEFEDEKYWVVSESNILAIV